MTTRIRNGAVWAALLAGTALLAGCGREPAPQPETTDKPLLALESPYSGQLLAAGRSAAYRFHAPYRGAYLIMITENDVPARMRIDHPKGTCFIRGNGSCELISSPDESYDFRVSEAEGRDVRYTLTVTHTDGTGRYEGLVAEPVTLAAGQARQGRVGVHESSYYRFRTGEATAYTIALSGTHSDLSWKLFDRAVFDVILFVCDAHPGAHDETCQVGPLHPDTPYYLMVSEQSGVPGDYTLRLSPR